MTGAGDERARERWEALDAALGELRGCRTAQDIERCVCTLARRACGAEQAALGALRGHVWWRWCHDTGSGSVPAADVRGEQVDDRSPAHRAGAAGRPVDEILGEGRRRVAVPVSGAGAGWLLELVVADEAWDEVGVELAASFTASLGRVMASVAVLQRVEEQRFVLARLTSAVTSGAERAVELVDGSAQDIGRVAVGADADGGPTSSVDGRLSPRQREVLDLMVRGMSNAEIAERLVVSVPTVKSHVRAVLQACGAVNRSEAITRLARGDVTPR